MAGMGTKQIDDPSYQLASGCLVDQLVGQYMSHIVGLGYLVKEENVSFYWKNNFLHEFEKSFKGLWDGESGVAQVLSRISYIGSISHLRRISLVVPRDIKLVSVRKLHSSSWGFCCPIDNPDGKSVGIIKSLALFCKISVATSIKKLKELLFKDIQPIHTINPGMWNILWTKVFLNSDLIGVTEDTEAFPEKLLDARRSGIIDKSVSLAWNRLENEYIIQCDAGRPLRYVYQENVKAELIKKLRWNSMETYMDLIDPGETETLKISMQSFAGTLSEIHGSTILSASASINPYIDHNQAPRNMFAAQQIKQTCSWFNTAFDKRFDTIFLAQSLTDLGDNKSHRVELLLIIVVSNTAIPEGYMV
jgi:DNA-directed RNA polymerase II subunit RPB2